MNVCPYGDTVCRLLERKPTIKLLGDMLHHSPFSGDFMQIVPRAFHFCSKIKACVWNLLLLLPSLKLIFFFKLDKPLRDKTPQNLWNFPKKKKVYIPLNFAPPAFWAKYIAIFSSHKISLYSISLHVVNSKFQNIDRK